MQNDLLSRLRAGTDNPPKRIKFPGTDIDIGIRVLDDNDFLQAGLAADRVYKAAGVDVTQQNILDYEAEKTAQLLFRAVVDPDTTDPVCGKISDFRMLCRPKARRDALLEEVNAYQAECSPDLNTMDGDAFDTLLADVKKNYGAALQNVSSIFMLKELVDSLARELSSSPTDNGST
jgi:hypothetical protein